MYNCHGPLPVPTVQGFAGVCEVLRPPRREVYGSQAGHACDVWAELGRRAPDHVAVRDKRGTELIWHLSRHLHIYIYVYKYIYIRSRLSCENKKQ